MGADRLCNVAAAAAAGLGSALIVDAGTATTFDLLLDGVFVGGLIAPGMAFAARCLGERAARLAPVPFAAAPLAAGRSTAEAMAAGGWHAGMGGVRHIVAGLLARHGRLPVIVTGGLGAHLADLGPHRPGLDPAWRAGAGRPPRRRLIPASCHPGRTGRPNSDSPGKSRFRLAGACPSLIFRGN